MRTPTQITGLFVPPKRQEVYLLGALHRGSRTHVDYKQGLGCAGASAVNPNRSNRSRDSLPSKDEFIEGNQHELVVDVNNLRIARVTGQSSGGIEERASFRDHQSDEGGSGGFPHDRRPDLSDIKSALANGWLSFKLVIDTTGRGTGNGPTLRDVQEDSGTQNGEPTLPLNQHSYLVGLYDVYQ